MNPIMRRRMREKHGPPADDPMVSARNLTGILQWHGHYRLAPDVWTPVPMSLAKRLIGNDDYEIEGSPAVNPASQRVGRVWKSDVKIKKRAEWPAVGVVVPVFNSPELLSRCLASFRKTDYPGLVTLALVDNGSSDAETIKIVGTSKAHRTLTIDNPQGFAAAVNAGMASMECAFYVLLNQDTEIIDPDWLTVLVNWMLLRPQCGIAGPKLLYPDGRIQHAGIEIPANTIGRHRFTGMDSTTKDANYYQRILAVTGAVFCVRASTLQGIGAFDESYQFSCEDTDLCLRASCLGWEVWYVAGCVVTHHEGAVRKDNAASLTARKWVEQSCVRFREQWGAIVDQCGMRGADALRNAVGT